MKQWFVQLGMNSYKLVKTVIQKLAKLHFIGSSVFSREHGHDILPALVSCMNLNNQSFTQADRDSCHALICMLCRYLHFYKTPALSIQTALDRGYQSLEQWCLFLLV